MMEKKKPNEEDDFVETIPLIMILLGFFIIPVGVSLSDHSIATKTSIIGVFFLSIGIILHILLYNYQKTNEKK